MLSKDDRALRDDMDWALISRSHHRRGSLASRLARCRPDGRTRTAAVLLLCLAILDDRSTTAAPVPGEYLAVRLKPNSVTLAGSELVRSWFELKFGLSSSLLAAN